MKTLAIVPIRSGSKRIPNKNIRLVNGVPLVFYTLDKLIEIKSIDTVVVSTDSMDYKELIENNYGELVEVLIRSEENSTDTSTTDIVISEVLESYSGYDAVLLVQATSPFTKKESIVNGIDLLKSKKELNSVATKLDFVNFHIDNIPLMIKRPRTQDMKSSPIETGCFWITRVSAFEIVKNRIATPINFVEVTKTEAMDIDTPEDMFIVESIMKNLPVEDLWIKRTCSKEDIASSHADVKTDPDGIQRDHSKEYLEKYEFYKEEIDFINSIASTGKKILDLGCGRGFVPDLFDLRYECYALEVNGGYYLSIKENVPVTNIHIGELKEDTYQENMFDVVFCGHVIEHVEDPRTFIENIQKILKSHGVLVMSTPNFGSFVAKRFKDNFRMLHDPTHVSLFSDESLSKLLDESGFHVDRIEYPFFNTRYFTQENVLRLFDTSQVSPPFYGNIFTAYCRKK